MKDGHYSPVLEYFNRVCRSVFDAYMTAEGFTSCIDVDPGTVLFMRPAIAVSFRYYDETAPLYWLQVTIAPTTPDPEDQRNETNSLALWQLLPTDEQEGVSRSLTFHSEEELRGVLQQTVFPLAKRYLAPLWTDPNPLKRLLEDQRDRDNRAFEETSISQVRNFAEAALAREDYAGACSLYERIPVSMLSAADRRRVYTCRKRIGANSGRGCV